MKIFLKKTVKLNLQLIWSIILSRISVYEFAQGKLRPRFIFVLFAFWPEGDFKTGLIQLSIKDFIRKLESGRIQDWVNQFQNSIGRK